MSTWTSGIVAIGEAVATIDSLGHSPSDNLTQVIELLKTNPNKYGALENTCDVIESTVTLTELSRLKYRAVKEIVCCECRTATLLLEMSLQHLESNGDIDKGENEKRLLLETLNGFERSLLDAIEKLQASIRFFDEAASKIKCFKTLLNASEAQKERMTVQDAFLWLFNWNTQSDAIERFVTMTEDSCQPLSQQQGVVDSLSNLYRLICESAAKLQSSSECWTDNNFTDPLTRVISKVLEICENFVLKIDSEN